MYEPSPGDETWFDLRDAMAVGRGPWFRGKFIHGLERSHVAHPGARPYRYDAPPFLVVEVQVIDLKGYDRIPKSVGEGGANGGAHDDALVEQGEVHWDDPGYRAEMEAQTTNGYLGEQVPALGFVHLFQIDHGRSGSHRRVPTVAGTSNSQYRHPSPPSAVLHLTNDEWRLNHITLGRSLGHVSAVQETDWSRCTTTAPGHSNNDVVRIVSPLIQMCHTGRLSRADKAVTPAAQNNRTITTAPGAVETLSPVTYRFPPRVVDAIGPEDTIHLDEDSSSDSLGQGALMTTKSTVRFRTDL